MHSTVLDLLGEKEDILFINFNSEIHHWDIFVTLLRNAFYSCIITVLYMLDMLLQYYKLGSNSYTVPVVR